MLISIVTHTPVWVWAIMAAILYRGFKMTQPQYRSEVRLPLLAMLIAAAGLVMNAQHGISAFLAGATGLLLGAALSWRLTPARAVQLQASGGWLVNGSYLPLLALIMIFGLQYLQGVLHGVAAVSLPTWLALLVSFVSASGSGILLGRGLKVYSAERSIVALDMQPV